MKMKFASTVAALSCLAASALSAPSAIAQDAAYVHGCLSQSYADRLVSYYAAVLAHKSTSLGSATVTAEKITASDYYEQSDSANIEEGLPLDTVTVPNKQTFVIQSQAQPADDFQTIAVYVSNCHYITWQWVSYDTGTGKDRVKGFHLFDVDQQGLLCNTHFEFNTLAASVDTGFHCTYPNGTAVE